MNRIAVIGVGWYGFRPTTPEVSFREMVFEASSRAYADAGNINPRNDVDSFISCQEDFWEGIGIADEFAPDQIGGAMRPTMTVTGDSLQGLAHALMHINSGIADIVSVEAHSKVSDILTFSDIVKLSMDPIYVRSINPQNMHFIAGLDAVKFMERKGVSREDLAIVVEKNKKNGLSSPRSSYASNIKASDVLMKDFVVYPLTELDIAPFVDGAITVVVADEETAKKVKKDDYLLISGIGYATDSNNLETAELGKAEYMRIASEMAYKMAKVNSPRKHFDAVFVDDRYSYKELEHLEGLRISEEPVKDLREGNFSPQGEIPVNPFGGHLAKGVPLEASGFSLLLDAIDYIRQGKGEKVLVASWRGIPTFTGSVLVVEKP
ncbi:acetyl-CoA acetyltransferase [Sulfolobus sp. A20]|uniref:thiolase domain-containing protein n=2 Tax=Sulfolobaceae TaxID=118883 RepID=UPI000845DDD5|nr:thiolase domain-containing protein [Sulfolobus sp. A20]TRM77849.1 thiolase domain-containing protein [Sulfolobus sp. A20-N-F8]TRM79136.1 thiolase domain-containing protein [Sulfolobus sp. B5]TRM85338.1 thiolase domain-containing protein [Sulfolobus sp. F3]TRM88956.1 thiolase domain-containing protein [Sulfolobus sp. E3]TRM89565.1 thiolase domain-containing protein [Sulfolobus sp. C3]